MAADETTAPVLDPRRGRTKTGQLWAYARDDRPWGGWRSGSLSAARDRQVSAKSKLGEAIRYALTRWDGLSRFIDDGRIDLDSNTVERSIRPLALNRKNALFAESGEGGDNRAVIATFIENRKISGINPHDWLTETLSKLASAIRVPASIFSPLNPHRALGEYQSFRLIHPVDRGFVGQRPRHSQEL